MNRNIRIDFLRGIAILSVLLLHFNLAYNLSNGWPVYISTVINALARNGNYGVTLFFVISGFLITKITLQRYNSLAHINLSSFYVFRFSRIMPCMLLALLIIAILSQFFSVYQNTAHTTSLWLAILSVLTFWHNVLMIKLGYFNYCLNILWSLSVEEIFYLIFPVICLTLRRSIFIIIFLAIFILFAPYYRALHQHNEIIALYGYFSCFDAIAIGCLIALLRQKLKFLPYTIRVILQTSAWLLLIGTYLYKPIMTNIIFGVSLIASSGAILVLIASLPNNNSATTNRPIFLYRIVAWFGANSYEFYLFHIIILAALKTVIPAGSISHAQKLICFIGFIAISALIVRLITCYFSVPCNHYLRQLLLGKNKPFKTVLL